MPPTPSDVTVLDDVTVLVVEDDKDLATLYLHWLADTDTVQTASDGEEALTMVDAEVDVVLLDRELPKLSGEAVLEAIRERDVPCQVVIVSGVEPDFDLVSMEFDGYLVKPVSREEIRTVVKQVLAQASYEDKLREFYALSETRAVLRERKTDQELAASEEYAALEERLQGLSEHLDTIAATIEETDTNR